MHALGDRNTWKKPAVAGWDDGMREEMDVREYQEDILLHMARMQKQTAPDCNMMGLQPELEWYMRPYLLDFLIEIHASFHLQPASLFLAVNLIDRYCSKRVVYKKHYQLVGCAALWIAAKYEDKKDRVPNVRELKQMCCNAYDEDMFIQMEGHVLNTLEWTIGHPTAHAYLELALQKSETSCPQLAEMGAFFCELALFHRELVGFSASETASASLALAQHILSLPYECKDAHLMGLLQQFIPSATQILGKKYAGVTQILEMHTRATATSTVYPPTPPSASSTASVPSTSPSSHADLATGRGENKHTDVPGMMTPPLTPTTWK